MGTDIHMACEIRNKKTDNWKTVTKEIFEGWNGEKTSVPYFNRNYNLFAILADVRNGYGFAGCQTGGQFNPISDPKGYPDDMCKTTDDYMSHEHSASWLTLRELLDYDWSQKHSSCGYVSDKEYLNIIIGKMPESWCGGVGGKDVIVLTEEEMRDRVLNMSRKDDGKQYYAHCWFPAETYAECAGNFYSETMEVLKTLIPDGGTADDVRIVFDFDS